MGGPELNVNVTGTYFPTSVFDSFTYFARYINQTQIETVSVTHIDPSGGGSGIIGIGNPHDASELVSGVVYYLDEAAQTEVANFFGASSLTIDMIRELGPMITGMGFNGRITATPFAQALLSPGSTVEVAIGATVRSMTDVVTVQSLSQFSTLVPGLSEGVSEIWQSFPGTMIVPEPQTATLLVSSLFALGALRRRKRN